MRSPFRFFQITGAIIVPAGISGNVIRADLETLADLPSDEAAGSAACAGCLGTWGPDTEAPATGGEDRPVRLPWPP
jgi:hypothetical protein